MNGDQDVRTSKFLALVLRHDPERIGLHLDASGWVDIDELLRQSAAHGNRFTEEDLRRVVTNNSKRRYVIDDTTRRIRANQGHSLTVDLGLEPTAPPAVLYHGTASKTVAVIRAEGIKKMHRQHVQLSSDIGVATEVGRRHGPPVVLTVDAQRMHDDGFAFFVSLNAVWLTDFVAPIYVTRADDE